MLLPEVWVWEDQPSIQDPGPLEDAVAAVAVADQTAVVVVGAKDAVAGAAADVVVDDEVAVGAAGATAVKWVVLAVVAVVGAASLE